MSALGRSLQDIRRHRFHRRHRLHRILGLLPLLPVAFGCGRRDVSAETSPEVFGVHISSPMEGDLLADTLTVVADVLAPGAPDRVTLLVDGLALATLWNPPWRFAVPLAGVLDTTRASVEIRAYDGSGNVVRSPQVGIFVIPNNGPAARVVYPYPDHYIDVAALAERDWTCVAVDPEEGELNDDAVSWIEEGGEILLGRGRRIPAPVLGEGLRSYRLEARDRWGRRFTVRERITIFRYPGLASPDDALRSLQLSVRSRDAERIRDVLDETFAWVPCGSDTATAAPAGRGGGRGKEEVQASFERFLDDPSLHRISWTWRVAVTERFEIEGREMSKIEVEDLDVVAARWVDSDVETRLSRGNRARLYLVDSEEGWRIAEWIALPRSDPPEGEPALEALLFAPAPAVP